MHVLIIKTSSMGDVIHTLPALTDAAKAIPDIRFDWVVEENFAEIPRWNSHVAEVIPFAFRRWRKKLFAKETYFAWRDFIKTLRAKKYDLIIDAQGLAKSAFVTALAKGPKAGLDWQSARESLASLVYQKKYTVNFQQHAIMRARNLFSQALGYTLPTSVPEYGIDRQQFQENSVENKEDFLVFLHGTTWATKHWPEEYWLALAKLVTQQGLKIKLPWGNMAEQQRAERIAASCNNVEVLPKLNLASVAKVLANAKAIVAVDTGLGHLAAALDIPTVSIYGPTNPILTGALGKSQVHLTTTYHCAPCLKKECPYTDNSPFKELNAPCFTTISPEKVWQAVGALVLCD